MINIAPQEIKINKIVGMGKEPAIGGEIVYPM
jgi:hypothetical protein